MNCFIFYCVHFNLFSPIMKAVLQKVLLVESFQSRNLQYRLYVADKTLKKIVGLHHSLRSFFAIFM